MNFQTISLTSFISYPSRYWSLCILLYKVRASVPRGLYAIFNVLFYLLTFTFILPQLRFLSICFMHQMECMWMMVCQNLCQKRKKVHFHQFSERWTTTKIVAIYTILGKHCRHINCIVLCDNHFYTLEILAQCDWANCAQDTDCKKKKKINHTHRTF